ncbi:MAG: YceI family protein [Bacteroidetes bacterium]|nr:YceI family protein [Bacteroidota bacterium]
MNREKYLPLQVSLLTLLALVAAGFLLLQAPRWKIDEPAVRISLQGPDVEAGVVRGLSGAIHFSPNLLDKSCFEVEVDLKTLDLGDPELTGNASSADWLDVAQYPSARFACRQVLKAEDGYVAQGDLSLHGQSRPVEIPFVFHAQGSKQGVFEGDLVVARRDFAMNMPGNTADTLRVHLAVPVYQ